MLWLNPTTSYVLILHSLRHFDETLEPVPFVRSVSYMETLHDRSKIAAQPAKLAVCAIGLFCAVPRENIGGLRWQ